MFSLDDTICAIASAAGGAARGIVRLSGPAVISILEDCFQCDRNTSSPSGSTASVVSGKLRLAPPLQVLEGDLFIWPDRRSYTRQCVAEFHTYGSPPVLAAVVREFCILGARPAEPGEFTLRAFLAGRIDLTQAEAVLGVIDAAGRKPLQTALTQLAGGLSRPLAELRERLLTLLAHLEAGLDFVEEDIEFISAAELDSELAEATTIVESLLEQVQSRATRADIPRVVLFGLPNVGKSSLFNAIVGSNSAIVSPQRGTTRDYLIAVIDLDGIACEFIDTAGIASGQSEDQIAGAARLASEVQRDAADVTILCLDSTRMLSDDERVWINAAAASLVVFTKSDLLKKNGYQGPAIATSSKLGHGITAFKTAIRQSIVEQQSDSVAGTAERCYDSLHNAAASLERARSLLRDRVGEEFVAAELHMALVELGKVVGTVYTDDILDRIFSRFCIGK